MKRLKFGLATQIFLGLILGVAAGAIWFGNPAVATYLQPVGDLFLRLIKMIVIPIVVSSLIVGVAGAGSGKKVGRLGFRTILYFEIITTFAIVLGLLLGNIIQPGHGVNFSGAEKQDISQYVETEKEASTKSVADTFLHIVPTNFFQSLAEGDLLAIICFTVLFALGVSAIGEKGKPVLSFFRGNVSSHVPRRQHRYEIRAVRRFCFNWRDGFKIWFFFAFIIGKARFTCLPGSCFLLDRYLWDRRQALRYQYI